MAVPVVLVVVVEAETDFPLLLPELELPELALGPELLLVLLPEPEPEPEPPFLARAMLAPKVMAAVSAQVISAAAVVVPSTVEILKEAMVILRCVKKCLTLGL